MPGESGELDRDYSGAPPTKISTRRRQRAFQILVPTRTSAYEPAALVVVNIRQGCPALFTIAGTYRQPKCLRVLHFSIVAPESSCIQIDRQPPEKHPANRLPEEGMDGGNAQVPEDSVTPGLMGQPRNLASDDELPFQTAERNILRRSMEPATSQQ